MDSLARPDPPNRFYRRRLPHWQPVAGAIFLTWRLYGSLPREALDRLQAERESLDRQPQRADETPRDRALRHQKGLFGLADELLAQDTAGPKWLGKEPIARLMVDALFYHHRRLYILLAFVVMPNHVHVLLIPMEQRPTEGPDVASSLNSGAGLPAMPVPLRQITHSLKSYVAHEPSRRLARPPRPFWQDESYDHWVRSEAELGRVVTYVESDPVRSGLADSPEEWRWSSAWERIYGRLRDQSVGPSEV